MKNKFITFFLLFFLFIPAVSAQMKPKLPPPDDIVIKWNAVPFVKDYILEIKNSAGSILVKKETKETVYRANFQNEGKYYYRLTFINRLGISELISDWKMFEIVKIYIPEIYTLSETELLPRRPYDITIQGKNFNQRNKLVLHQVFREKADKKDKNKTALFTERLGDPIPLKHTVESEDKLSMQIPNRLLGTGNYKIGFLFRDKSIYLSPKPLFSVEPQKFISRLYIMPSYYWIAPLKYAPQRQLFWMGFGFDIRWGTRLFKNRMEVGVATGMYGFFPNESEEGLQVSPFIPIGLYIGYNAEIPSKSVSKISFMPYMDLGYDFYFLSVDKDYKSAFEKKVIFFPKTNLGILFLVEKNKNIFSMGVAVGMGFNRKQFIFSGVMVNIGFAKRLEYIPKKRGE